jgi:hypothetical protein
MSFEGPGPVAGSGLSGYSADVLVVRRYDRPDYECDPSPGHPSL